MKANRGERAHRASPYINVTPLIDVLLVLLIIFMVVTPLKPSRFKALVPEPPAPDDRETVPDELTLVVTIEPDLSLKLNRNGDMGTTSETGKLSATLADLFLRRKEARTYRREMLNRVDVPEDEKVVRTVFIKAPRSISYGEVARVIDGIKVAGASPIGLQIDGLN
ncbi:MAG: biopolymer transport protein TolR [Blastocatellia bacterium]|jgi:biopolymer transport protein ExbD|nr:biopolymer transport protein TolR [Blastocatellia bacterium]